MPRNTPAAVGCSRPFQLATGIQNSALISESLDGLSVAVTRQNAGRSFATGGGPPKGATPCGGAGGVNFPASTIAAEVIVAAGSEKDARLWQLAAIAGTMEASTTTDFNRILGLIRLGRHSEQLR